MTALPRHFPLRPSASSTRRRRIAALVAISTLAFTGSAVLATPGDDAAGADDTPAQPADDTTTSAPVDRTTTTVAPVTTTSTTTTTTTTTKPTTASTTAPGTTVVGVSTTTSSVPNSTPATTTTSTTTTTTTTTPAAPAPRGQTVYAGEVGNILATIRYMESRGQYHIPPNKGNASGAYQFIASTWQNYGGYEHAYLAPPYIQDERAFNDVTLFLKQWNNDVSMVPVLWYYPKAAREPALMDVVPVPSAGNVLTIREYQQRWLAVFSTISGEPIPQTGRSLEQAVDALALPPTPPERDDGIPSIEFPVLGPANIASPDCDTVETDDPDALQSRADIEAAGLCTAAPPSIVFGVKLQPIRAAVDGVITAVDDDPSSGRPITVTITDVLGRSYIYAGFNDDNPGTSDGQAPEHLRLTALSKVGTTVWAGQIIGFMGDTSPLPIGVRADVATDASITIDPDAIAPHIRLSIIDVAGNPIEAFGPVIDALFVSNCKIGIGRWSVPPRSTTTKEVTIETTDEHKNIDSEWVITSKGQVHATGWAAMMSPNPACPYTRPQTYGPGADGSDEVPAHWKNGLDLPTGLWLSLALAGDDGMATPLLRF